MSEQTPVAIGMTGLGGYALAICRLLRAQSKASEPLLRLAAVCEPDLKLHADLAAELRAEGVAVMSSWDELLAQPIEAVWLPLPIPLHRPYTEQALASGKAVMCEKPAAGCLQDLDAMAAARERSGLPVALGFQDIYEPSTVAMKRALVSGAIGKIRSATLTACWPRDSRYYGRSAWAGAQKQNGVWVMDSPASNALAHFINLALFLLGTEETKSAGLTHIEAELYRVNPIENYDTCGMRIVTETESSLLVLLSHACRQTREPRIVIYGEHGTLNYQHGGVAELITKNGTIPIELNASRDHMASRFANLVRGRSDDRYTATLEIGRAHLAAVNGASEAAKVSTVDATHFDILPQAEGQSLRAIPGIEDLFEACARDQCLPHESGLAAWTVLPGHFDLHNYTHFSGPAGAKD